MVAETVLHALPHSGSALGLSSLVTVAGDVSAFVMVTSSIHQPSSPGLGLNVKIASHVSQPPALRSVFRKRMRARRPAVWPICPR